jgi:hypothetical protein
MSLHRIHLSYSDISAEIQSRIKSEEERFQPGKSPKETAKTDQPANQHIFKVLMLGADSVGKTSLLGRFVDNTFRTDTMSTIGIDFKSKSLFSVTYLL